MMTHIGRWKELRATTVSYWMSLMDDVVKNITIWKSPLPAALLLDLCFVSKDPGCGYGCYRYRSLFLRRLFMSTPSWRCVIDEEHDNSGEEGGVSVLSSYSIRVSPYGFDVILWLTYYGGFNVKACVGTPRAGGWLWSVCLPPWPGHLPCRWVAWLSVESEIDAMSWREWSTQPPYRWGGAGRPESRPARPVAAGLTNWVSGGGCRPTDNGWQHYLPCRPAALQSGRGGGGSGAPPPPPGEVAGGDSTAGRYHCTVHRPPLLPLAAGEEGRYRMAPTEESSDRRQGVRSGDMLCRLGLVTV